MSRLGPFITLAAGAALAAGLGVASVASAPQTGTLTTTADATSAATSTATVPPVAEATTSVTPAPATSARPAAVKADYAGRVRGNGGLVAVSVRNGKAVGYFCDGRTEAWFAGKAGDGEVTLKGFGGATLSAVLDGGKATGELALGGKRWDFTAPTVKKPSGLYRATALVRGARYRAGWIVLSRPDGNGFVQVGAMVKDGDPVPVPTITPGSPVTIDGDAVSPKDVDAFIEEMS
ncbi:hypothetical protein GCM10010404_24620 [Nonomuraea africana]|uniref:Serine/threonine protein kinase n=1 Tax=Nonomuraea africana TaxID=46171 RepID=A0ABR9KMP6_9ACTN|nr:hypothetical protein [Nonomuraea africana]MBE1563284.1 hypothetical protein [Nonomuraea africana]